MKSMKNKCKSLCKKAKTQYFKKRTSKNSSNNKNFWNLVNRFPDKFIEDEKELVEIFNNYYINIVEKMSGKPVENSFENCDDNLKEFSKSLKNTKNIKVF